MSVNPIFWLLAAIGFVVLEAMTLNLVSIWFAVGSAAALLSCLVTGSFRVQAVVFVAVSTLCLLALKPLCARLRKPPTATNGDRALGREAVALTPVSADKIIVIKPSDHICLFHGWKFGADDLTFLPSDGTQLLFRNLEHIAEKGIVLFHIFAAYGFHLEILFVIHISFPFNCCLLPTSPTPRLKGGTEITYCMYEVLQARLRFASDFESKLWFN